MDNLVTVISEFNDKLHLQNTVYIAIYQVLRIL